MNPQSLGILQDKTCPYCVNTFQEDPADGVVCPMCEGVLFVHVAPNGFRRLVTQLHKELRDQCWPSYVTREQCMTIVGTFQFSADAIDRELRLGARHDTEAVVMLLAAVASSRAMMGNAGEALHQLMRMAGRTGFPLRVAPDSRAVGQR